MILGIPVVDGHDLTNSLLKNLAQTVTNPAEFVAVIIDNGSDQPYKQEDFAFWPFRVDVIRYEQNKGYYTPLGDLHAKWLAGEYPENDRSKTIGLIHNDMVLHEVGWNQRMQERFDTDPLLGLVGMCGSNELDERGGRGGGTVCFFSGQEVLIGDKLIRGQDQAAGRRIVGLEPACVLDSLFMMFKAEVIPRLITETEGWDDLTLAHFYDRIWPCRVIEAGYRVGTMGIECDHLGGMTTTGNVRYRDDCIKWLEERNIPYDNPETEMYLVAERRFLGEYRDQKKFLPCKVGADYGITHYAR